jgi:Putative restriction endonuclease
MVLSSNKSTIKKIIYPESDGKPMADNTKQWKWIVYTKAGFDILYKEVENFVAGDLFWYPVEGDNKLRQAPDVLIAFNRPKGHRGSYRQWEEDDVPPKVVFEIWSPGNRRAEKQKKFTFYETYGVEEYYEYDPDRLKLFGWLKENGKFKTIKQMHGWVSPLTGVRFELHPKDTDNELKLFDPHGKPFMSYMELQEKWQEAEIALLRVEQINDQERSARLDAEKAQRLERQQRLEAEQGRDHERQARFEAEQKLQALLTKLQAHGINLPE